MKIHEMFVGVDGCKKGWLAIAIRDNYTWEINIFQDICELWNKYKTASLILIDIPIGLPQEHKERICDKEARKLLGKPRSSSVFPVPSKQIIQLSIKVSDYKRVNSICKEKFKKGLSKQTWYIIRKIREINNFLKRNQTARKSIRETHPEICFQALAGFSMKYSKKTQNGFEERKKILKKYPFTNEIIHHSLSEYNRNEVAKDDILDALSLAVTAKLSKKKILTIPEKPEYDSQGLRMEMVYPEVKLKNRGIYVKNSTD